MSALPVGQHLVCITHAEGKANSKGTGTFAALTLECIGQEHTGKTITDRLNLQNPNDKAVRIATEKLGQYIATIGLRGGALSDPQDLCFLPFIVEVVAGKDGRGEVKSLRPCPQDWRAAADAACAQLRSRLPTPPSLPATAQADTAEAKSPNVVGLADFVKEMRPPHWVWQRVLQTGSLIAFTASWGAGKTAFAVPLGLHVAAGKDWAGKRVAQCKVLYLCGENPNDVKLRVWKAAEVYGIAWDAVKDNIHFTQRPFAIDNDTDLAEFIAEAEPYGPFGLVIVDTGPAHSEIEDEDSNSQMKRLAMALRKLMDALGSPATLALMHPVKNATRDNITARGGGAFVASADGEILGWRENRESPMEVFHRMKFRGAGFEPMFFKMETHAIEGMTDNFGEPVETVVAMPTEERPVESPSAPSAAEVQLVQAITNATTTTMPDYMLKHERFAERTPQKVVMYDALRDAWAVRKGMMGVKADTLRKSLSRAVEKLLERNGLLEHSGLYWLPEWEQPRPQLPPGFLA